jgi:hypothetical protein
MIKQITWDDQWIGYDDNETIALKESVANDLCFGGTMVWSVDFDGAGSGDAPGNGNGGNEIYFDPSIWLLPTPTIGCIPPCTIVLPPFPLASSTTVSWPPLTTSFLHSSNAVVVTKTTTILIPAVTTDEIAFFAVTIDTTDTAGAIIPVQSVMPPGVVLTLPGTEVVIPPFPIHPPTPQGLTESTDGSCGGSDRLSCVGSSFGNCCSSSNFCGNSTAHCGAGCNPLFGICEKPTSTDGTCGGTKGHTCKGSLFGDCCSASGFCGTTDGYCIAGCQNAYGDCGSMDSSASPSSTVLPPLTLFGSTSHTVTVQPYPTISITTPPHKIPSTVSYTSKPPSSTCTGRCGSNDCDYLGCYGRCGAFGCDGGCG